MSLRDEQVELTRRAIIETVVDLSADPSVGRITVAEVARRSGISPATIYRHFPDRDALVGAAAMHGIERWEATRDERDGASVDSSDVDPDPDEAYLRDLWSQLADNIELARHGTVTETGRELRVARFAAMRAVMERSIEAAGVDLETPDARHLLACLDVLTSAHAFLDLHDRQGLDVDAAVDAVLWGSRTLISAAGLDPALFTMTDQFHCATEVPT